MPGRKRKKDTSDWNKSLVIAGLMEYSTNMKVKKKRLQQVKFHESYNPLKSSFGTETISGCSSSYAYAISLPPHPPPRYPTTPYRQLFMDMLYSDFFYMKRDYETMSRLRWNRASAIGHIIADLIPLVSTGSSLHDACIRLFRRSFTHHCNNSGIQCISHAGTLIPHHVATDFGPFLAKIAILDNKTKSLHIGCEKEYDSTIVTPTCRRSERKKSVRQDRHNEPYLTKRNVVSDQQLLLSLLALNFTPALQ